MAICRPLSGVSRDDGAVAALDAGAHLGADTLALHLRLRSVGDIALAGRHPAGRAHTPFAVLALAPGGAQGEQFAQCARQPRVAQHRQRQTNAGKWLKMANCAYAKWPGQQRLTVGSQWSLAGADIRS